MGCNYLSLPLIPAYGTPLLIFPYQLCTRFVFDVLCGCVIGDDAYKYNMYKVCFPSPTMSPAPAKQHWSLWVNSWNITFKTNFITTIKQNREREERERERERESERGGGGGGGGGENTLRSPVYLWRLTLMDMFSWKTISLQIRIGGSQAINDSQ